VFPTIAAWIDRHDRGASEQYGERSEDEQP
jgi:hypothetical protein